VPRLTGEADPVLLEALHTWRTDLARATSKPAYTVLGDATLAAIAELKPASVPELARVQGIGPAKIDKYGPDLLALVAGKPRATDG
jgi:DNA helicase-2/ATP-dependent DNA helicase PcrA